MKKKRVVLEKVTLLLGLCVLFVLMGKHLPSLGELPSFFNSDEESALLSNSDESRTETYLSSSPLGEWEWVNIFTPINNGNVDFGHGDHCGIDRSQGTVRRSGSYENGFLYTYTTSKEAYGTRCPNGTVFSLEVIRQVR